jgi:ribosomal protein L16 Arg81 hydroxylase
MELSPVLRRIRDFYFKQALAAPVEVTHVHARNLVPDQQLFSLEHLRRHLNQPLIDVNYLNFFQGGKTVDLSDARVYKVVQRRKIEFVDHRVLQRHLEQGAACVLEGLDILEPAVNELASVLDRAHAATFCNATAFFSQRGNEAYRGHVDTDDVLVIHVAGEKLWRLYRRQPPRRVNLNEMTEAQMGPLDAEIVMRPGDVLYLRSFTPHRVETLSPCSLHVSFDLCDRQPNIEMALQLLLRHYDRDASPPLAAPRSVLDKLMQLGQASGYEADLAEMAAREKAGHAEFRRILAANRITHFDRFVDETPRTAPAASASPRR